ncbi:MAG: hypothetical protein QF886_22440, partial [Planctomycetota bacterium]|nr:hypothetical protein [Planctomycetota bacterium]
SLPHVVWESAHQAEGISEWLLFNELHLENDISERFLMPVPVALLNFTETRFSLLLGKEMAVHQKLSKKKIAAGGHLRKVGEEILTLATMSWREPKPLGNFPIGWVAWLAFDAHLSSFHRPQRDGIVLRPMP